MKAWISLALVLLATAAAVAFHARKIETIRQPQDTVAHSLEGVKKRITNDRPLKLRLARGVPWEYFFFARLALAPRHVELIRPEDAPDTVLLIKVRQQNDSLVTNTHVVWSSNDDAYDYLLLSAR